MKKNIENIITDNYKKDMLIRMVHSSTAIEGNTLTLSEVNSILINKYIPREMTEKEYTEVKNYRNIFPILLNLDEKILTPEIIKIYNKVIMTDLREDAGLYKRTNNIILGANFETVKPYKIPYEMQNWCDDYNFKIKNAKTNKEKVEVILEQHIKFEKIHPFADGNGRTGRLLIVDSCFREKLIPIIIPHLEKNKYINFLAQENLKDFTNWGLELQKNELDKILLFQNNR